MNVSLHRWPTGALQVQETCGVSELVSAAFIRITTNRRSFTGPATPAEAVEVFDENGATFIPRDRGSARFPGLRLDPLAA